MLQKPLLTLLALLWAMASWAQECTLQGIVYYKANGQPLTAASVQAGSVGAFTDEEGHFSLRTRCADTVLLTVRLVGYVPQKVGVDVAKGSLIKIYLSEDAPLTAKEVVIAEAAPHQAAAPGQSVATLEGRALARVQGLGLADQLATIPGVAALRTGPSVAKPVINGLYGERVLIVQNGVRLEGQQWGADHAPELDPYGAARLQVVRGAASLRYGADAIGGVVLADPAPLPERGGPGSTRGRANLAGFSNGRGGASALTMEGGMQKLPGFGWRVQGSSRRLGSLNTPEYQLANTPFAEGSYSAAIGYVQPRFAVQAYASVFTTRLGLFSGASVGTVADLEAAIARPQPLYQPAFSYALGRPNQLARHWLSKVQGHYHISDLTSVDVVYAAQLNRRKEYDLVPLSGRTNPELDLALSTQTLTASLHHHLAPGLAGEAGVQGITQGNVWAGQFLIPNYRSYAGGAFVIERYALPKLTLEAGARLDYKWLRSYFRDDATLATYQRTRTFVRPSVSLGAEYTGLPVTLGLHLASAWRPPSANELYSNGVHQSAVSFERGNAAMTSETSYNAALTAALKRSGVEAEVTGYINYMPGYIYLKPDLQPVRTVRGAFPAYTYTQTDALLRGMDAQASVRLWRGLSLKHKSAWLWASDTRSGGYLVYIPAQRFEHALRWESLVISDFVPYVQVSAQTVLRQYRAPAAGDYAPPPPDYTLASVEVGATLQRSAKSELIFSISVANALNACYRDYLNRYRYFVDEQGRNVALRVTATF